MPAEPTFSTIDLRSNAQEHKRDAAHKHKWALGATGPVGRPAGSVRPSRPSETEYSTRRREAKGAVASLAHGAKMARKHHMLEAAVDEASSGNDETSSEEYDAGMPSPAEAAAVMYSFDAPAGPVHDSQILRVALAKAVERFEERETVNMIKSEYDVLDSDGETVALSPVKKGKALRRAKAGAAPVMVPDADDDYEFV